MPVSAKAWRKPWPAGWPVGQGEDPADSTRNLPHVQRPMTHPELTGSTAATNLFQSLLAPTERLGILYNTVFKMLRSDVSAACTCMRMHASCTTLCLRCFNPM